MSKAKLIKKAWSAVKASTAPGKTMVTTKINPATKRGSYILSKDGKVGLVYDTAYKNPSDVVKAGRSAAKRSNSLLQKRK